MRKLFILLIALLTCGISVYSQQKYHDAALHDLRGNVKSCADSSFYYLFKTKSKIGITFNFAKDGKEENSLFRTIERDNNGYIIKGNTGRSITMLYRYKLIGKEWLLDISGDGEYTYATRYIRNAKGYVIQAQDVDSEEIKASYSNYKFDSHGNWIYRIATLPSGRKDTETRTITYWDDTSSQIEPKNSADALLDNANDNILNMSKSDLSVKDVLDIPFLVGQNRNITAADLEKSMRKYRNKFYTVTPLSNHLFQGKGSYIHAQTLGITIYGNKVKWISYSVNTPLAGKSSPQEESYITEFHFAIQCQNSDNWKMATKRILADFNSFGIKLSKCKYTKDCKGWKGANDDYEVSILFDKYGKKHHSFSVIVEYKK